MNYTTRVTRRKRPDWMLGWRELLVFWLHRREFVAPPDPFTGNWLPVGRTLWTRRDNASAKMLSPAPRAENWWMLFGICAACASARSRPCRRRCSGRKLGCWCHRWSKVPAALASFRSFCAPVTLRRSSSPPICPLRAYQNLMVARLWEFWIVKLTLRGREAEIQALNWIKSREQSKTDLICV